MLKLSGLDEESMTDERRDTFIDMAENLGLDPGEAEDMVDELPGSGRQRHARSDRLRHLAAGGQPYAGHPRECHPRQDAGDGTPARPPAAASAPKGSNGQGTSAAAAVVTPVLEMPLPRPLNAQQENQHFPDFINSLGGQMLFVPSTTFVMGSAAPNAAANEQPTTRVTLGRYYLSRHPITNAEYEKFDPAHRSRRGAWADDRHPVIYVSYADTLRFCQWLSGKERKRYRLPTEAEWEWAAKGDKGP